MILVMNYGMYNWKSMGQFGRCTFYCSIVNFWVWTEDLYTHPESSSCTISLITFLTYKDTKNNHKKCFKINKHVMYWHKMHKVLRHCFVSKQRYIIFNNYQYIFNKNMNMIWKIGPRLLQHQSIYSLKLIFSRNSVNINIFWMGISRDFS